MVGIKEPTAGRLEFSMVVVEGLDWVVDSTEAGERMSSQYQTSASIQICPQGETRGGGRGDFCFFNKSNKWVGIDFSIRAINRAKAINEEMQWQ